MEPSLEIELLNDRIDSQVHQIEELQTHLEQARTELASTVAKVETWLAIADHLADNLATYEAIENAGIGENALVVYRKARHV